MINFSRQNRHWSDGFSYGFEKKRALFSKLLEYLPKCQAVVLTGLRRTGKTVLLKQLVDHLVAAGVGRTKILYFSFDDDRPALDGLFSEYAAASGASLEKDRLFFFLDEVQKLPNWQGQLKVYYDNYENLKFFVTGSASLFVHAQATESLAGRVYEFELPPLSFAEYLAFRGKERLSERPSLFNADLRAEFLAYLRRDLVELVGAGPEEARLYLDGLVNKVVFEDIPSQFPVDNPDKLKALLLAVCSNPGLTVNYERLASDLGLSAKTLERYLSSLERAFLVRKSYNFSRNFLTSEKKMKKVYCTLGALCFSDDVEAGKSVENAIAIGGRFRFFWRNPQKDEVDFVARGRNGEPVPVESKFTQKPSGRDFRGLLKFCSAFGVPGAVLLTDGARGKRAVTYRGRQFSIRLVPAWEFALDPVPFLAGPEGRVGSTNTPGRQGRAIAGRSTPLPRANLADYRPRRLEGFCLQGARGIPQAGGQPRLEKTHPA